MDDLLLRGPACFGTGSASIPAPTLLIVACFLGLAACASSGEKKNAQPSHSYASERSSGHSAPDYAKAALANVELGLGYLEQGQIVRAKTKLIHAMKLAPSLPEVHSGMAYFLETTGEYKDAEKAHKKAIRLSKYQGAAYNNYGAFLCRQSRFQEADKAFHSALEDRDYPRTAEIYENAGLCAIRAEHKEQAIDYLKTALVRDPNTTKALIELADLAFQQDELEEAKYYWQRYRKLAQPTARSLSVGIKIARSLQDDNAVASQALMLKNLFEHSPEYADYLRSERTEVKAS